MVLAPPAVAAIFYGFPWFELVVALAAGLMAHELAQLSGGARRLPLAAITAFTALSAIGAVAAGHPTGALVAVAVGAAVAWSVARPVGRGPWGAGAVLYLALPCTAAIWLRNSPEAGRDVVLWIVVTVWANDIGGYLVGKTIGGPKLAPSISPGKTWAGLVGGLLASAAAGMATAWVLAPGRLGAFAVLSVALGGFTQAGDLVESWIKRHFGVKDSGVIIPGHGGVLDRLDGMLVAMPAVVVMLVLSGGTLFAWR